VPPHLSTVVTLVAASGDATDYDEATRSAIKKVIATEAAVESSAVELTISAGSVLITAVIRVTSGDAAGIAGKLSSGIFSSATVLESALESGGVSVVVAAITSAPTVVNWPPSPPPPNLSPIAPLPPPPQAPPPRVTIFGIPIETLTSPPVILGVSIGGLALLVAMVVLCCVGYRRHTRRLRGSHPKVVSPSDASAPHGPLSVGRLSVGRRPHPQAAQPGAVHIKHYTHSIGPALPGGGDLSPRTPRWLGDARAGSSLGTPASTWRNALERQSSTQLTIHTAIAFARTASDPLLLKS